MKFTLMFKTPDVTDQLDEEELEEARRLLDKFIKYDECVTLEFDTVTREAKVLLV